SFFAYPDFLIDSTLGCELVSSCARGWAAGGSDPPGKGAMDSASSLAVGLVNTAGQQNSALPPPARREPWWVLPGAILITLITLTLDLVMPRGASPDIGYCAAMLMAAATGRIRFL